MHVRVSLLWGCIINMNQITRNVAWVVVLVISRSCCGLVGWKERKSYFLVRANGL